MILNGHPSKAICDGCGAEGEPFEARNRKTGALTAAFLPRGWKYDRIDGEDVHRCAGCVASDAEAFGDRREAFEARLENFGIGMVADIAASLGVPAGIGRRWAAEWDSTQRKVA